MKWQGFMTRCAERLFFLETGWRFDARKGLVAVFTCLALILSCSKREAPPPKPPLKIGWFLWTGWYPMVLAKDLGLFEKHGVSVQPILYQSYNDILPDLGSGKLDAGYSGMYETLKANIPGLKIVLVTDHSVGGEGLVVSPSIRTPKDLKGKRIGCQGALSGSEFLITTFLRKEGLSPRDLTLVGVPPEEVLNQMPAHIDGGYTWDPYLTQAQKRGFKVMFTTASMPGLIVDVVAFHGSIVKDRPEEVKRFVDAWFEAVEFWKANPAKAAIIIANGTGQKPEDITLTGCRLFSRQDNQATFNEGGKDHSSVYFTAQEQVKFFIGVGDASTAPSIHEALTPDFIK